MRFFHIADVHLGMQPDKGCPWSGVQKPGNLGKLQESDTAGWQRKCQPVFSLQEIYSTDSPLPEN